MCGRFSFQPSAEMLKALSEDKHDRFETGDIIVPNMPILFYRNDGLDIAQWGFKPDWAGDDFKASTHNARSETIAEKTMFKEAWAQGRRCFIPANYFFEWQHGTGDGYSVHSTSSEFLYFAGLWEENNHGLRVTIITKASGENVKHIHRRMPLMMERQWLPQWLKGNPQQAIDIIQKAHDQNLEIRPYEIPKKQQRLL